MAKKSIVIGGGLSGLATACYLAKSGHQVTLLEKNTTIGGRLRTWENSGFLFDMGPSWYWMPEVFENFYNDFGYTTSDFYELIRLSPSYSVFFENSKLEIPSQADKLFDLFESVEKGAGEKLKTFLEDAAFKYNTALNDYVNRPSHSVWEFMDPQLLSGVFKLNLFSPLSKQVQKVVRDKRLAAILEFPVLFLGSTPHKTPALYSMMNHADLTLGTWYPMGGMHHIAKAFSKIAKQLGVAIKTEEPVIAIESKNNQAAFVVTEKGKYAADYVVSGADYQHTEQNLLAKENRNYVEKYWESRVMSPSSLLFYLGINRKIDNLTHHNLFFDADFEAHANAIYDNPRWPEKPLFYACVPSKTDATVAPENCENIFLLMPLAPGIEDTEPLREKYFNVMLDRLEQKTGSNIRDHIVVKRSYCVADFKSDYNSYKGNAYGLANTLMQTAFLKPKMKSKKLKNLYFTGQLTVPGPGMPPAIISGKIAANEILKLSQ